MNNLQIFNNSEFGQIRMVEIEGKQFAVASDVAKSLGYKDSINAIKHHCRWVAKHHIPHPQNPDKFLAVNVIPEGDIYRLVSGSELPSAEKFERWVFDEILPAIRKTGTYSLSPQIPQTLSAALRLAADQAETIEHQSKQLNEQKPKVVFAESVECSKGSILVKGLSVILKQNGLDIGQNRLFERLRNEGYLCRQRGYNFNKPTQKALDLKVMQEKTTTINRPDREPIITNTPLITGKGQVYFVNKFLSNMGQVV